MNRDVYWTPWNSTGLEHLHLAIRGDEIIAESVIIGVVDGAPFRVHYEIRCDHGWRTRAVRVVLLGDEQPPLVLLADGAGRWTSGTGQPLPELDGCIDLDLSVTPFTNTLPIRRQRLARGDEVRLRMVYVRVPDLAVFADPQGYTCLQTGPDGGLFRYRSLDREFTADLPVDADGIVIDYPGLWRRLPSP